MLDHVRHVEAVAIIKELVSQIAPMGTGTVAEAALAWCAENHPPPEAYMAAMTSLVEKPDA